MTTTTLTNTASIGSFGVAQPSISALTLGEAMQVIALMILLQQLSYQVQKATLQESSAAATAMATATQNSGDEQAAATEANAGAMIAGGGAGVLASGAAIGTTVYNAFAAGGASAQLNEANELKTAANSPASVEQADIAQADAEPQAANTVQERLKGITDKLKRLLQAPDMKKAVDADSKEIDAKATLEAAAGESDPAVKTLLSQIKIKLEDKIKDLTKSLEQSHTNVQNLTSLGSALSSLSQGIGGVFASQAQTRQAAYDAAKALIQFVQQSLENAVSTSGQTASGYSGSVSSSVATLLQAVAQANTPV